MGTEVEHTDGPDVSLGCEGWVYSTARDTRTRLIKFESVVEPTSEIHAKEVGTVRTVCGLYAFSWVRFWDMPFGTGRFPRCERCEALLQERSLHVAHSDGYAEENSAERKS